MILQRFTVFDSKAESFLQPFYSQAIGSALRSFEAAANEVGHDFQKYGADYTLFHLGSFDQATAEEINLPAKVNLGLAITFTTQHPDHPPVHLTHDENRLAGKLDALDARRSEKTS